jgi:polyisoprenoid-binding protein YceI
MKKPFAGPSLVLIASLAACSPAPGATNGTSAPVETALATIEAPAAATPVAITVPAGDYVSDANHSSVTFQVQHLGLANYTMTFKTFDATVTLDPSNIPASKVVAKIKPSDILAGYPGDYAASHPGSKFASWEDELANSTNFLNGKQVPEISFVSTAVEPSGDRTAKVTGDLTLLGVTKPVTLDVRFDGEAASHYFAKVPAVGFSATGKFKRSDFGHTYLSGAVGDEVTVIIESDMIQKTPS